MAPLDAVVDGRCRWMAPLDAVVGWLRWMLSLDGSARRCLWMAPLDAVVGWLRWTLSLNVAPVEGLRNVDTVVE